MNEIEAGSMYERSINIHAIQKMEVTVKILRIVLYIAAFASCYSLSHAVNIRYCIKNVSNDSAGFFITSTMNQLQRSAGVYILSANTVKTLQEQLIRYPHDQALALQIFKAQPQTANGQPDNKNIAGFTPTSLTSYFFKPLIESEMNKNFTIACHINPDTEQDKKIICQKQEVKSYTAQSCTDALAQLETHLAE